MTDEPKRERSRYAKKQLRKRGRGRIDSRWMSWRSRGYLVDLRAGGRV